MNRQWKGVIVLAVAFIVAFIVAIAFHSMVGLVAVLLSGIVVAFVLGIAWMRTVPPRIPPGKPRRIGSA